MAQKVLLLAVLAAVFFTGCSAAVLSLTGDVVADFRGQGTPWYPDVHNAIVDEFASDPWTGELFDVGVPTGITNRAGWDMRSVYLNYDRPSDTLQIGIDCYLTCGDADSDGNQGAPGSVLDSNGGDDKNDLSESETFSFIFDTRFPMVNPEDGFDFAPDYVIGWPGEIGSGRGFGYYTFDANQRFSPSNGFVSEIIPATEGFTLTQLSPSSSNSYTDIEFELNPFTNVPGFQGLDSVLDQIEFKFNVFAGSFEDDGIGEDWIDDQGTGIPVVWEGCTLDECNLCQNDPFYELGRDSCDLCPYDDFYGSAEDECGICFGPGRDECDFCSDNPLYNSGFDECGLCADQLGYETSLDSCGICFGSGRDECNLCPGDEGFEASVDECGICFGSGRDICLLCPADEGYLLDLCFDCENIPFGDWEYNRCGMCLPPAAAGEDNDDLCPCYFDTYKGFDKWDLDRVIAYYNTYVLLWDVTEVKFALIESLDWISSWSWEGENEDPTDWAYWCELVFEFHHSCVLEFTNYVSEWGAIYF